MDATVDDLRFGYAPKAPVMLATGTIGRNDKSIEVMFDSGGSPPFPVFISVSLAEKLKLPLSAPQTSGSLSVGGNGLTYRTAPVDRFVLGPVRLENITAAVIDIPDRMSKIVGRRFDAIVGTQFLSSRIVAIDFVNRRIDLAAEPGPADTAQPLGRAANKPLMLVTASINGKGPFTLEIDTGASITSLSPAAAARAGIAISGRDTMNGAGGSVAIQTSGRTDITIAGQQQTVPMVSILARVDDFAKEAGTPIDGILGTDWLHHFSVILDAPDDRIWISRPKP